MNYLTVWRVYGIRLEIREKGRREGNVWVRYFRSRRGVEPRRKGKKRVKRSGSRALAVFCVNLFWCSACNLLRAPVRGQRRPLFNVSMDHHLVPPLSKHRRVLDYRYIGCLANYILIYTKIIKKFYRKIEKWPGVSEFCYRLPTEVVITEVVIINFEMLASTNVNHFGNSRQIRGIGRN